MVFWLQVCPFLFRERNTLQITTAMNNMSGVQITSKLGRRGIQRTYKAVALSVALAAAALQTAYCVRRITSGVTRTDSKLLPALYLMLSIVYFTSSIAFLTVGALVVQAIRRLQPEQIFSANSPKMQVLKTLGTRLALLAIMFALTFVARGFYLLHYVVLKTNHTPTAVPNAVNLIALELLPTFAALGVMSRGLFNQSHGGRRVELSMPLITTPASVA
mmetsp:Transcript_32535/g.76401  ORF Transcript_32535/g.76401 Transcript_32535/m.76401 type:complete len:218 (+) Transcript_32535:180-833(+)